MIPGTNTLLLQIIGELLKTIRILSQLTTLLFCMTRVLLYNTEWINYLKHCFKQLKHYPKIYNSLWAYSSRNKLKYSYSNRWKISYLFFEGYWFTLSSVFQTKNTIQNLLVILSHWCLVEYGLVRLIVSWTTSINDSSFQCRMLQLFSIERNNNWYNIQLRFSRLEMLSMIITSFYHRRNHLPCSSSFL